MKNIKGYRVTIKKEGEFGQCFVRITLKDSFLADGDIAFRWQNNLHEEDKSYYAGQYEVNGDHVDTLKLAAKLLNKISFSRSTSPRKFIGELEKLKINEVAYHNGKADHYTKKDWPEGNTYMATINKPNGMGNLFTVLAEDENAARIKAIKQAGEYITQRDPEDYITWLQEKSLRMTYKAQEFPVHEFNTEEEEKEEELQTVNP